MSLKIFKNRKGATVDNFFVVVTFFALAIFFIVLMVFWNQVSTIDIWDQSSVGPQIRGHAQDAYNTFDFILVIVYFGLHLGILLTAYFLRTHPFMYVIGIILLAILALIAAPLSNAYQDFIVDTEISAAANDIPITNNVMRNLPLYEIIFGLISLIVLYGFARGEGFV